MKKRDLKSLRLNKKSISSLDQQETIKAGAAGKTILSICRSCRESRCRLCASGWEK